jgi:hypothetical protein
MRSSSGKRNVTARSIGVSVSARNGSETRKSKRELPP